MCTALVTRGDECSVGITDRGGCPAAKGLKCREDTDCPACMGYHKKHTYASKCCKAGEERLELPPPVERSETGPIGGAASAVDASLRPGELTLAQKLALITEQLQAIGTKVRPNSRPHQITAMAYTSLGLRVNQDDDDDMPTQTDRILAKLGIDKFGVRKTKDEKAAAAAKAAADEATGMCRGLQQVPVVQPMLQMVHPICSIGCAPFGSLCASPHAVAPLGVAMPSAISPAARPLLPVLAAPAARSRVLAAAIRPAPTGTAPSTMCLPTHAAAITTAAPCTVSAPDSAVAALGTGLVPRDDATAALQAEVRRAEEAAEEAAAAKRQADDQKRQAEDQTERVRDEAARASMAKAKAEEAKAEEKEARLKAEDTVRAHVDEICLLKAKLAAAAHPGEAASGTAREKCVARSPGNAVPRPGPPAAREGLLLRAARDAQMKDTGVAEAGVAAAGATGAGAAEAAMLPAPLKCMLMSPPFCIPEAALTPGKGKLIEFEVEWRGEVVSPLQAIADKCVPHA